MLYLISGVIGVVIIILIIIAVNYNRFRFTIIKIDEAENNIEVLLKKKIELLDRTRPIIKKELKLEEFLEEIDFLKESQINHFEMNDSLKECHTNLIKILDDNEKLFKSDTLSSIIEEINSNEEAIVGCTKFYNDSVVVFNKLVGSFPSNLVAFLWRYKRKEFYNNEKREMYEILNEK